MSFCYRCCKKFIGDFPEKEAKVLNICTCKEHKKILKLKENPFDEDN